MIELSTLLLNIFADALVYPATFFYKSPNERLIKGRGDEYCGISVNTLGRHGPNPTKIGNLVIYAARCSTAGLTSLLA